MDQGSWEAVLKNAVPQNAYILGSCFVLRTKGIDTDNENSIVKNGHVTWGHRDKYKAPSVQKFATCKIIMNQASWQQLKFASIYKLEVMMFLKLVTNLLKSIWVKYILS